MSNTLAIAAVTSTVRYVLDLALAGAAARAGRRCEGDDAATRAGSPTPTPSARPPTGINVFLYQVTPNHAWNLTDLPTRRPDGIAGRAGRSPRSTCTT